MNTMTTAEAAKKWGISTGRITTLAQGGRIPGARRIGHQWMIPADAEKPADARTRAGRTKKVQEPDTFRYSTFEYRALESFDPPLNREEKQLKATAEAFYACRFTDADRLLGRLPEKTTNRYRRITAFYYGCMIDIYLCNAERFIERYSRLHSELQEDFPHREELKEYLYLLDISLGAEDYYKHRFHLVPGYAYHESFLPHLAMLCAVPLSLPNEKCTSADLNHGELSCILLENAGAYADLQFLHMTLYIAYRMVEMEAESVFHFKKALELAQEYDMYYNLSLNYFFIQKPLKSAFAGFPEELKSKVTKTSKDIHRRYVRFMDKIKLNSIYKLLTSKDFIFLYYAVQGLTNKEIAARLHTSVGTVGKRFGEIYALLDVDSKAALVELYQRTTGRDILRK